MVACGVRGAAGRLPSAVDDKASAQFFGSDADFTVTKGSSTFKGSLRAVDVLDSNANQTLFSPGTGTLSGEVTAGITVAQLAAAMQAAVNKAIGSAAVTITNNGGKLQLSNNSADAITLTFTAPIKANAGGGRITLDTPQYKISTQALNTAATADRRIEITVDSANTAFTEMGISGVPTRFDGKTTDPTLARGHPADVSLHCRVTEQHVVDQWSRN